MTEVVIVGAGLIGMLTARELHAAGLRVTLIERGASGQESSWAGGGILSPLYPLDRQANADGQRLLFERDAPVTTDEKPPAGQDGPEPPKSASARGDKQLPPLLKRILEDYSAQGLPPAYLPKNPPSHQGETPCMPRDCYRCGD